MVVPQGDLQPTDLLSVTWSGTAGAGSHTTTPAPISTIGREIPVPVSVIAFNLGKPVTVTYTVTRGSSASQDSLPFTLNVQTLPVSELKQPLILEAANSGEGPELDITALTAGGTMRFLTWPHIAVGQFVWLDLLGFKANGDPHNTRLMKAPGSYVNQGWIDQGWMDLKVPYSYLKDLGMAGI
ncbi:hypothetical protein [Pseudomonas sp. F01002]|uniref:hypothetical protein n=1 Tax=Pseudomonas sp. F01002 TaxID=2555724 RepID=UPI00106B243E|nr:hypothetical protein [Pseudomonas sp. F01002]TFB35509.1 hypothetical protein E3W21_25340 [Pseudomonas sp. F01002]